MTKTEEIMNLVYQLECAVKNNNCDFSNAEDDERHTDARESLKSAIEELVADAARYRHIKSNIQVGAVQTMLPLYKVHHWHGYEDAREYPDLCAAVDAAMKETP